jgi:ABC-type transporter Mla subunit MlaD
VNTRRRRGVGASTPVLIGAVTVLVAIIAVFLAYNANNGLPFVPRYTLRVEFQNAEELTPNADVHLGGDYIGSVSNIQAARNPEGKPIAVVTLALNKSVQPLPVDSTFIVRLKGSIGLKYVQVIPGSSHHGLADGATVPVSQTGAAVDLDQVFNMFNAPTRHGITVSTGEFAYGLAGRGVDLNSAIHEFVPLVTDLGPVARNLSSSKTNLAGFFHGLESFSSAVAPVAQEQAQLYVNLNTTFTALAGVAVPYLQEWISQTPPTEQALINQGPTIRSFVTDTAALFKELEPGFSTLHLSAPVLTQAETAGIHNLPATVSLDQQLGTLAQSLQHFGQNPAVQGGLDRLTLTATSLKPPLAFLTPVQATCNYVTLFLRNTESLLSNTVATGTALQFILVAIDDILGSESVPSQTPFLTPLMKHNNHGHGHGPLHVNPYPNTASPGQVPQECAAGNETYSGDRAQIGNPPGNVGLRTEVTRATKG